MNTSHSRRTRTGLSTPELLGCLLAVAGGVWVGVSYFGVDLNEVAYVALDEAELLDTVPEDWRPNDPDCPDGECIDESERARLALAAMSGEREKIFHEINLRRQEIGLTQVAPGEQHLDTDTENPTLRYWRALGVFVENISEMEREAEQLSNAGQVKQSFDLRHRVMGHAQSCLEALDATDVDKGARETCARLAEWYRECESFSVKGAEVATKLAGGPMPEPEQKAWERTKLQLSKRADLLLRKLEQTRTALQAEYSEEFSPIQPHGLTLVQ